MSNEPAKKQQQPSSDKARVKAFLKLIARIKRRRKPKKDSQTDNN